MSASSMPTYKISLSVPNSDEYPFEDPSDIPVASKQLNPIDAEVHPVAIQLFDSIAKDIAFRLRSDFKETIAFRVSLSQTEGTTIHDERFSALHRKITEGVVAGIPLRQVGMLNIEHLKRVEVDAESEKAYCLQAKEPCAFIDVSSYLLWEKGVRAPVDVNLEISRFVPMSQGGGLTTVAFRFPHMYLDMITRFAEKRRLGDLKVCIVGPGLHRPDGKLGFCSQFVELKALFPNAEFLLLDKDRDALKFLDGQLKKMKVAAYDPLVFRAITLEVADNSLLAPAIFQPMLTEIKDEWATSARISSNAKEMLDGYGEIKPMMINVNPEQIELRYFDINTSKFKEGEKFDVMVATLSLILAFCEEESAKIEEVFTKFLDKLNDEGSLYIDAPLMHKVLIPAFGCESPEGVIEFISVKTGVPFNLERLGLETYLTDSAGDSGTLPNPNIRSGKKDHMASITTHSIYVLTKNAS